jgi:hypothetical protein
MKKTLIVCLLLISTAIFSQSLSKTDALKLYFAGIPAFCETAGAVVFQYESSQVNRETPGNQSFETILKSGGMFQDKVSFGKLKYILVNGKTVHGAKQDVAPDQAKPLFEGQEQAPRRTFYAMADSASVQHGVNEIKKGYDDFAYFAETFWEQFFNVFEYVKWIFYGVGSVTLYFALVGQTEYTHTGKWQDKVLLWIQRTSSLVLFLDITVMVAMYLIQAILKIKTWDLPVPIILFLLWLLANGLAWATSYVIPNATVSNGGFGYKKGGGDEYERKQLQNRN